jgi:chromosome partitioning protein
MILVVGAEKGGVGKTLFSTNIAVLAANDGADVLLMDTDLQGSSMSWARIRNENGIEPRIPVMALPHNPVNELVSLAPKYDLIIVDIGAQNYLTMQNTAAISDMILIPVGPDQLEVESTLQVSQVLKGMDARHKNGKVPAYIVLNNLPTNPKSKEASGLRSFFTEEDYPVFDAGLCHRSSWRNSRRSGLAIHELSGASKDVKASAEMLAIYEEIKARQGG